MAKKKTTDTTVAEVVSEVETEKSEVITTGTPTVDNEPEVDMTEPIAEVKEDPKPEVKPQPKADNSKIAETLTNDLKVKLGSVFKVRAVDGGVEIYSEFYSNIVERVLDFSPKMLNTVMIQNQIENFRISYENGKMFVRF